MSSQLYHPATILQYVAILAAIYVFLNGPFAGNSQDQSRPEDTHDMPLSQEKAEQLVYPEKGLQCPPHSYKVHIFSKSPLVVYIPEFLTEVESKHMIQIRYIEPFGA